MSETISALINDLPKRGITVFVLNSIDFVVPGQWDNLIDFEAMVKQVTKETDPALVQAVIQRADQLYSDPNERYQKAMRLYRIADKADKAMAMAAMADKVGEKVRFLSFIRYLTPKSDTAQTIDFSLKLMIELLTFCQINGIPGDSVSDFVKSLADYNKESLVRMAGLVCLDGIVPLGSDISRSVLGVLERLTPQQLGRNATYKQLSWAIPGKTASEKLIFINNTVGAVKQWIDQFVKDRQLTPAQITASLQNFIEITDDRLDYIAAFLDLTTNYYTHTGTQTLARRIIERAVNEI